MQQTAPYLEATPLFPSCEGSGSGEVGAAEGETKETPEVTRNGGKVMLVDDVITAGTAIRESMEIIAANGADLSGVLIALDRQEKGKAELSAIQEVERDFNTQVVSIVKLADLITYLEQQGDMDEHLQAVKAYRDQYGVA